MKDKQQIENELEKYLKEQIEILKKFPKKNITAMIISLGEKYLISKLVLAYQKIDKLKEECNARSHDIDFNG